MRRRSPKLLTIALSLFLCACPGGSNRGGTDIFQADETQEAAALVSEANVELRKIKQLFNEGSQGLSELEQAMRDRDEARVRAIADGFVTQINKGSEMGEKAIEKIRQAEQLNINEEFREYLSLKSAALSKYIQAFEERRQAAIILRDGYDPKNAAKRDQVVGEFKAREEKFKTIMEEARQLSEDANVLAKESMRKAVQ